MLLRPALLLKALCGLHPRTGSPEVAWRPVLALPIPEVHIAMSTELHARKLHILLGRSLAFGWNIP